MIEIDDKAGLTNPALLSLLIETVFSEPAFRAFLLDQIAVSDLSLRSHEDFIALLQGFFEANLAKAREADRPGLEKARTELAAHIEKTRRGAAAYRPDLRANPAAVFWPNPTREGGGALAKSVPIAEKIPLIDKSTPIASAGSCFAFEIAKNLQARGFNYVVSEPEPDGSNGVVVDGYAPDRDFARFSAAWGLIFNTPSLRQLAERAFGASRTPSLVVRERAPSGQLFFTDPFREGVAFGNAVAYRVDKPKHADAVRRVLSEAEIFVATLGLNECWRLRSNGVALSRNPRSPWMFALAEPAVLTVEENVAEFEAFLSLVREHNPKFKVVLSLSPIPLIATHRLDQHVIAANAHSKSVLRVAAEEIVRRNQDVFYFPSYEHVMHCADQPWTADERHVRPEAVAEIMRMFDAAYLRGD
ncbi:MAG: GSCFA domain-containing protein [Alphaproteobacteria bacterium]|nr:GSCFA domain-containing protein [Alphaproteobacteria bacterium]